MYYVFLNLVALVPVVDASLSLTISRLVSYAMAGATRLEPQGIVVADRGNAPNQQLLRQLLFGTRAFYRLLALVVLLALCVGGTGIVGARIQETSSPALSWLAWGITLLAATWEIYSSWGNVFLQGMNQVLLGSRLAALAYALRLLTACALLLSGAGLLSVPIASLCSSTLQRSLSHRAALRLLGEERLSNVSQSNRPLFAVIWPNSWRVGLKLLSMYFSTNAVSYLCLNFFGLAIYGQFGLSLQVMTIVQGMSAVWTWVKWPLIGQLRSRQEVSRIRDLLWPRLWLQSLTFIVLAALALYAGPPLLAQWGAGKSMLPIGWLTLLVLYAFMEMQFAFWTHLLSTENLIPSLWATVVTYSGSVLLTFGLLKLTPLGLGAIVLGPFIAGGLFNYWYWPMAGARSLQTSWLRFTFSKPTVA